MHVASVVLVAERCSTSLNSMQIPALHTVCLNGHSNIAKLLIERGAMVNAQREVSNDTTFY